MENGLIRRIWRLSPNAATVRFDNLMTDESLLRGVKPEVMVEMNGISCPVGGLRGQPNYAYLRSEWLDAMTRDTNAFQFTGFDTGKPKERVPWKRKRYSPKVPWPPPGVALTLHFAGHGSRTNHADSAALPDDIFISVHYEMYDGIPLLAKWFSLTNRSGETIVLNSFVSEILALVEGHSRLFGRSN